jgi:MFS family permease
MLRSQFGVYVAGNTLSLTGTWMQRIACGWLVWDWTGSAFWVGVLAASDLLPVVVISPFAGVAADRSNRLRLNVIAQAISAANALAMVALLATGQLGLWSVLGLTFLQGLLTAATQPARFAMVQQMVERSDVGAAVGLNSASVNIARLLGPAAAGILILHDAIGAVFALNAAVTVAFVLILRRLRLAERPAGPRTGPFLADLTAGFAHVGRSRPLRLVLAALFAGGACVRSVIELLPAIAAQSFATAEMGLAVMTGAAAVGAIGAGLSAGASRTRRLLISAPLWWAGGAGAALLLTQSDQPWLATVASAGLGGAITCGLVSTQTFVQLTTPDAMRGRALSVFGLIARGSPALGALAIGYAADRVGMATATLAAAACLAIALALLAGPIRRAATALTDAD